MTTSVTASKPKVRSNIEDIVWATHREILAGRRVELAAQRKDPTAAATPTAGEIHAVLQSRGQAPELASEQDVQNVLTPPPPPKATPAADEDDERETDTITAADVGQVPAEVTQPAARPARGRPPFPSR